MRGKKIDTNFVSTFISDCISQNITSSDEIKELANIKISDINNKIIEVEKLKILRSKLLDVVSVFEKNKKSLKEESKILELFSIKNTHICKYICNSIFASPINENELFNSEFFDNDITMAVYELVKYNVIFKIGNSIVKGNEYHTYMKYVLCEV